MILTLIKKKAQTPLHIAVENALKSGAKADAMLKIQYLLARPDIEVNILNSTLKTPLDLAKGHPDIANLLQNHGALLEQELPPSENDTHKLYKAIIAQKIYEGLHVIENGKLKYN